MADIYLNFSTQGQKLLMGETVFVASGAAQMVKAKFATDDPWTGLTKYGRFKQGFDPLGDNDAYDMPLGTDGSCSIPHEVLAAREFNVCLIGEDSTGNRLTTDAIRVRVAASIDGPIGQPDAPTESIFQQIKDSEAARVAAEEERQEAEAQRVTEFAQLKSESEAATASANAAASAASDAAAAARGNVLTGTESGRVIAVDDAYAAKPREARVAGRTVNNLWVNPTGSVYGVTATETDGGALQVSGTSTSDTTIRTGDIVSLKASTQYTVIADKAVQASGGRGVFSVYEYDSSGFAAAHDFADSDGDPSTSVTFTTLSDMEYARLIVWSQSGATVSGTYRVMLVEGSSAPDCFVAPGLHSVDECAIKIGTQEADPSASSTTVDLQGRELRSLPDGTADELVVGADGGASVTQRTKSVTIDGETVKVTSVQNGGNQLNINVTDAVVTAYLMSMWCDTLPVVDGTSVWTGSKQGVSHNGQGILTAHLDGVSTVEDANAWFAAHPTTVVYPVAEPTSITLDAVTLPALPAPDATVWADTGAIPTDVSLKYEQDINIVIDELKSAIVASAEGIQ